MHTYKLINSFGELPFTGNPVAVFLNCDDLDEVCMQKIAAELKLSETTFVCSPKHGGAANVRIFTPVNELGFAGHPLLGTALALAGEKDSSQMVFETRKGEFVFTVKSVQGQLHAGYVEMEQPIPVISRIDNESELLKALGVSRSTMPIEMYDVGPRHVFVGVDSVDELSTLTPDHNKLSKFENMAALCFCPDNGGGWRMRMFSPAYGVVEDAATGSAAGPLALHLSRHGVVKYGEDIKITQGVEMERPSYMVARASMDNGALHLRAGGYAYVTATGQYYI